MLHQTGPDHCFQSPSPTRYQALDFARGVSVLSMCLFHLAWDVQTYLHFFYIPLILWQWGGGLIGGAFLFIAGVSAHLATQRHSKNFVILHAVKIFLVGVALSLVSRLVLPQAPIVFGILHCIGVGVVLCALLPNSRPVLITLIVVVVVAGIATEFLEGSVWWVWAGVGYPGFRSSDYFPLFPWAALVLGGRLSAPALKGWLSMEIRFPVWVLWLGRHSLLVYLVHQPVFIGIIRALAAI